MRKIPVIVFTLLTIFASLTGVMAIGLFIAHFKGIPVLPVSETGRHATLAQALLHLSTRSMKSMVALSALEAMSNGIQFVKNESQYRYT